jgi:hypothetical protein
MSFLRNLLSDLVEKRLWPVAVLLVGALVAVPVVLGGGSDAADTTAAVTPATGTKTTASLVQISDETADANSLAPTGDKRNPFTPPKAKTATTTDTSPAKDTTTSNDATSSTGTTGTTGTSGGAGTSDTSSGTTTTTPSTSTDTNTDTSKDSKPDVKTLGVTLKFGEPGVTKQTLHKDVARLTPLPSVSDPFLVFLGVQNDRKTATFLLSSDATATGDATCHPSKTDCQTIDMKAGDSTFLDVDLGTGPRQFRLDLVSISDESVTATKASAARARVSVAGRDYLRSALESGQVSLGNLGYSEDTGTLVSTPKAKTAGPSPRSAYQVDLTVAGHTRTDVRRLALLPSHRATTLLFQGVRDGGRTAVFVNVHKAAVTGAGTCSPTPLFCRRVQLHVGQTAVVGGVPVTVDAITLRRLASDDAASEVRERVDEHGSAYIARHDVNLGDFALDPSTGTLTVSPL